MGNGDLNRTQSQMTVQEYAMNEERRYRLVENQIKTAENLLQQMFEDEIGSEDMGPETLNEIEELEPVEVDWKKMTFDTIGQNDFEKKEKFDIHFHNNVNFV